MKGELTLTDSAFCEEDKFTIGISAHDFNLEVYVDEEESLEKQLKNRELFDYCMDFLDGIIEDEDQLKQQEYISEHFDNILDSVEYIKLSFEEIDNIEFIKKNPIVLTKKIVLDDLLDITDYDKLMELIDKYKDIIDKVYVHLSGNTNYVSLLDCYKTINVIKEQANSIKELNLSPMETIMYVYDQVRNRVYVSESEDETSYKSRDLSEVLFGDKIVCAGYANIFHILLHYIGIDNLKVHLSEKNNPLSGHARNVVYVKDDKYNIDGVYYFDPTWNSKRKNETSEYLYRYTYFAKTRKFMDDDKNYDFIDDYFPTYSTDMGKKIKKIIRDKKYTELKPYTKSLNYMSGLVTHTCLINPMNIIDPSLPTYGEFDEKEFLKKFEVVFSKFNKEISGETLLKILNKVRKLEYYQNPELYPYSLDDMYKTFMMSNWEFKEKHVDKRTEALNRVLGIKQKKEVDPIEAFVNYAREEELFKELEEVRLTKVLQLVKDQKIH